MMAPVVAPCMIVFSVTASSSSISYDDDSPSLAVTKSCEDSPPPPPTLFELSSLNILLHGEIDADEHVVVVVVSMLARNLASCSSLRPDEEDDVESFLVPFKGVE